MKNYELYKHPKHTSMKELVAFCAETYGEKPAFCYMKGKTDVSVSFSQFKREIETFGAWLLQQGYKDCHIAVFGENSYEWILTYLAVACGKNVIVPIDKDLPASEVAQLLQESNCKAVVYSKTYEDVVEALSAYGVEDVDYISMKSVPEILAGTSNCEEYQKINVAADDLASIVFTSGTTGKSKGVMLTHNNFMADNFASCSNVFFEGATVMLLPLHHTFGLLSAVFVMMMYGLPTCINKSLKNLSSDLKKYSPHHLYAVPLIVETLYKNIWTTAKKQGKDKLLRTMIKVSNALLKVGIDLRRVLFKSVQNAFGGNLNLIISGGAPIEEKYIKEFYSLGITVLNGYGITECGPVVAVNRNKFNVIGSVGTPICCNQVKIAEDGEVLVKGENVMVGYYNDPEANESVFVDGWFRTGDIGFLDKYGALHISGRKKNLIILSNGENIAAEWMESQVHTIPYVKEVVVYGHENVITAEVYLDEEVTDAKERIHGDIEALNRTLPQIKNIGKVIVRDTEFPKTTTKKIKRHQGGTKHDQ